MINFAVHKIDSFLLLSAKNHEAFQNNISPDSNKNKYEY